MSTRGSADGHDLVVVGAGATGLAAARAARSRGRRVLLVEAAQPGGDCTHVGCVPSKALLETARRVQAARSGPEYGFRAPPVVDLAAVADRVAAVVAEVSRDESPQRLRTEGIDLLAARVSFTAPRVLRTDDGRTITAARIVLATGATPAAPPVPGLDTTGYLTNEDVFGLRVLPEQLLVLGGGPLACELAQAFRRLGSQVCVIEAQERLIPREEPEAAAVLRARLEREGVVVRTGVSVAGAGPGATLTLAGGEVLRGSHLLVATGRRPATAGLGLAAAGIETEPDSGRIAVDARLRTSAPGVYAAGDCASPLQFTHTGDAQGRLAAGNALGRRQRGFDTRVIPWVTFTDPEIGHVGLTETQAHARYGERARVVVLPFAGQDRARCSGETDGFVKLIAAPTSPPRRGSRYLDQLVGMTAVCPVGGELVHEAVPLMAARGLAVRLALPVHAYPTWSLSVRLAAAALFGRGGDVAVRPARADGGRWPPE
jgi:pyruvate/2-oxoglutarate dehydrogenase complex dihydrolipoamide dehydrogenase (E3) component